MCPLFLSRCTARPGSNSTSAAWKKRHTQIPTLAPIAGHSNSTITQRYCHPQADAIEPMPSKGPSEISQAGTKLGTVQNSPQKTKAADRPPIAYY